MSRRVALLLVVLAAGVVSCGGGASSFVTTFSGLGEHDQLVAASGTVALGGRELALDPFLWRDFMPPGPPEGSDLMASITVATTDGSAVPAGLEVVKVYVVNGDQVWVSSSSSEGAPGQAPSQVVEVARGGPQWGPAIDVDVYVKLRDSAGTTAYLAALAQPINATY